MPSLRLVWAAAAACLLALVAGLLLAGRGSAAATTAPRLSRPALPKRSAPTLAPLTSTNTVTTSQRTFVSTSGSDSNACTATAPCRSFGAALVRTTAGGEVVALTSGGYGPVGIGMAVTIVGAPGVHAAISVTSGDAIDVTAGSGDAVVLHNPYLNGLGADLGILYTSGKALELENVTVSGFGTAGVWHDDPGGELYATDVDAHDNGYGILVNSPSGTARASLDGVRAEDDNYQGIILGENASARVSDCIVSGNGFDGVAVAGVAMISGCQLSDNVYDGLNVYEPTETVQIGGSTVTHNLYGIANNSTGTLQSFGDNLVAANSTNTWGTIGTISKT